MISKAVILAGGFGTRLQHVVPDMPKSMAPVCGRSFLEYQFEYLINHGIREVYLSVGHRAEAIESFFGNSFRSLILIYAYEEHPLGTGGGLLNAMRGIHQPLFVLNGDTFFDVPLQHYFDVWLISGAEAALALKVMEDVSRYGTVRVDNDRRITQFREKGAESGRGLINGGIYIIDPAWLRRRAPGKNFSLERDVFEQVVTTDHLLGVPFEDYFIDIGIPEDYEKAQHDFRGR